MGRTKSLSLQYLQVFGLIITAEPYFSVIHPSDQVVAENGGAAEHQGIRRVDRLGKFEVLEGKEYVVDVPADQLPSATAAPNVPLDLLGKHATPWPLPRRQALSSMRIPAS